MAARERREEYSSNVVRVLHPTRPLSPGSNMSDVDTNLDYLLDDLQSSVSRPDSSLAGQRNVTNYSSSRDVQYLSPSNTTTIIKERSTSPSSNQDRVYKTASYQYSSSGGQLPTTKISTHQNASQLDTLLQDLKNEREVTRDKDYSLIKDVGIDAGLIEPGTSVTKTTRVYSSSIDGKPIVQRELIFDSPDAAITRTSRSRQNDPSYVKTIETKTVKDVSFEPVSPEIETIQKSSTINRYNYSDSTRERNVSPYSKTITVDSAALPADLKNVPLADDILPVPGTKVTTTVRTYTYEIPSEPATNINKTLLYKNEQYNTTNTSSYPPERDIPSSVVFKTESYNTINSRDGYPPGREPSVSPIPTTTSRTVVHKRDTRETTNLYPGSPNNDYPGTGPRPRAISPQPPTNTTIVYKHDVTNTNINQQPPNNWGPGYPPNNQQPYQPNQQPYQPNQQTYQPGHPGQPSHPEHPGQPTTTYYYKHESSNTKNTLYGPPGSGQPPQNQSPQPIIMYPSNNNYPDRSPQSPPGGQPRGPVYPNQPNTVTYKYSQHTTTSNTHGSPSEREPLLQPAPFPVDGLEPSIGADTPPKRLDDLLASFGGQQPNGRPLADEPYTARREVQTAVATSGKPLAIVDPKVPSKNIAGPPVYYPPGHEMFTRKEESGAAWRAQGGYARASGKYEYEAESKSKTKSKSGATMVPVCLPLCCAMPCSIM